MIHRKFQFFLSTLFLVTVILAPSSHAIIGGVELDKTSPIASHIIALQMEEKQSDGSLKYYKGTGVLITDRVVLTAGHNFYYLPRTDSGSAIFSPTPIWGPDDAGQVRIRVKQVEVYPGFKQTLSGTEEDLAVVLLQSPVPRGYGPLPMISADGPSLTHLETVAVAGYGKDVEFDLQAPLNDFRLRQTDLQFLRYSDATPKNSGKIWFDQSSKGFCGGDSGAPALALLNGKMTVYGIAIHPGLDSQGKMRCLTQGAFTNVLYYRSWIDGVLKSMN